MSGADAKRRDAQSGLGQRALAVHTNRKPYAFDRMSIGQFNAPGRTTEKGAREIRGGRQRRRVRPRAPVSSPRVRAKR